MTTTASYNKITATVE